MEIESFINVLLLNGIMARTKVIDYPDLHPSDAIEIAKKIVASFKSGSIAPSALAQALGHKNETSGTFLVKLADLRKYKLIDGRGTYTASELAKRIATAIGESERDAATTEMVFNIPILKQLYDVFQSNTNPSEDEFYTQLLNLTKEDRVKVKDISEEIRKLYIDGARYINMKNVSSTQMVDKALHTEGASASFEFDPFNKADKGAISFSVEGISLKIKNDKEHLKTAQSFIKLFLDEAEQNEKKEEKHGKKSEP